MNLTSELKRGQEHSKRLIKENDRVTSYIYTNVLLNNDTNSAIRAEYINTSDIPIVPDQQDYKLRITRMKIPMSLVPLFRFKHERDDAGHETTDSVYWLAFGLVDRTTEPDCVNNITNISPLENVIFESVLSEFLPPENARREPYDRAVFNIMDFLDMVNHALAFAWVNMLADVNFADIANVYAPGVPPVPLQAPTFRYDCEHGCIHFVSTAVPGLAQDYPTPFYPNSCGTGNTPIVLLLSAELYSFFNGFPTWFYGSHGVRPTSGVLEPRLNNALYFYANPDNLERLELYGDCPQRDINEIPQTTSSVYSFQRVSRIIITTNIALVREGVFVSVDGQSSVSGNAVRLEVLTDFEIPQEAIAQKQYIYYFGHDDDRYHNIKDSGDLRRIDLKIFVQWQDLSLTPLLIQPGHEANVKLQFKRKTANKEYQITDTGPMSHSTF